MNNYSYANVPRTFDRGFTLHEHYDDFNLINMNGRMYDPVIGRMLSPDIAIQDEYNPQAYNRYTYCFNNPLRFTDPSGYFVTIPPEFEKYYMPQYFDDFETYKRELEKMDAKKVSFNTDQTEGKSVTTLSWMIENDAYQMTIVDHGLRDYSQMCENSCVAVLLATQEQRFPNGNPEITEEWVMSTANDSYDFGLYADQAAFAAVKKSFVYKKNHYFSKKNFLDYEGHAYREMADDNGVYFRFESGHGHAINASMAIEFSLNGQKPTHEIRLWDAGLENGETAGFRSLLNYYHPDKQLSHKMGILIHKKHYK